MVYRSGTAPSKLSLLMWLIRLMWLVRFERTFCVLGFSILRMWPTRDSTASEVSRPLCRGGSSRFSQLFSYLPFFPDDASCGNPGSQLHQRWTSGRLPNSSLPMHRCAYESMKPVELYFILKDKINYHSSSAQKWNVCNSSSTTPRHCSAASSTSCR